MNLSSEPSLSPSSSRSSPCSKHSWPGSFSPIGLHVLVVDDDPLCLVVLERMLRQCNYKVTTCNHVRRALQLLRENKDLFDIVLSDVYMPDEDGFKLLEVIGLELDLPVIMMSANGDPNIVMQGITHGACDYLIKPIRMEELTNIWQHMIRQKGREAQRCSMQGEIDEIARSVDLQDQSSKKRKDFFEMEDSSGMDGINSLKKARVNWSIELHRQFVDAVNQLGVDKAVPKRILDIMNVQGLTRENVASHLQKYRLYLKRLSGVVPEPCPIAWFQAEGNGTRGGSMKVQPAGKVPLSNSGVKGRNLGAGIGLGAEKKLIGTGTLESLAKYKLHQQQHAANRAQVLGGLGLSDPKFGIKPPISLGLQRMGSLDLNILLQNGGTSSVLDQSMDPVDDLAASSFRTVKLDDEPAARSLRTVKLDSDMAMISAGVGAAPGMNPSRQSSTQQGLVGQWRMGGTHEQTYKHGGAVNAKYNVGELGGFDDGESRCGDVSKVFLNKNMGVISCTGPMLTNVSTRKQPYIQPIPGARSGGGMYAPAHGAYLGAVQSHFTDDAMSSTNVDLLSVSTDMDVSGDTFLESTSFGALPQLDSNTSPSPPPLLPPTSQLMQSTELDISDYLQLDDGLGFQC